MASNASAASATGLDQTHRLLGLIAVLSVLAGLVNSGLTELRKGIVREANAFAREQYGAPMMANPDAEMGIMREVQIIGGAVIMIAIVVLVVNEVLTVDAINNSSGPFSGVITSLEGTGVAAMTLLVVGLLVLAARAIMRNFGGGGF